MSTHQIAYDLVGDVHGYAVVLERLLLKLGYVARGGGYRAPPGRQLILLGDLIDRGPHQPRVLEIARNMVDSGDARVIMGNHEFNAIGYATLQPEGGGECYRPNRGLDPKCAKNRAQHAEFLAQVGEGSAGHLEWVEWFKTLPPFLELGGVRAVHGSWNNKAVAELKAIGWTPDRSLDDDLLEATHTQGTPAQAARKRLTCGLELELPQGHFITDKSGDRHHDVRIADWRDWATEVHQVALVPKGQEKQLEGLAWPANLVLQPVVGAPVFIGHHWFSGQPAIESPKLACLDWSAGKGGALVAYRWDGEDELSNSKLVWVDSQ